MVKQFFTQSLHTVLIDNPVLRLLSPAVSVCAAYGIVLKSNTRLQLGIDVLM